MRPEFLVLFLLATVNALKYPNEILDIPIVLCEPERIVIKVRTTSSNPSRMYAEDFGENPDCSTRNMNKVALRHGFCGMSAEKTDNPGGVIQRICISVQLHPLFVTESDKSYCAQCVYVESHVLDDFEQALDISDAPPTELGPQFDFQVSPQCSYTIRKGSRTGPEVHFASIGESVFHVWSCQSENTGILVQNCHVEDGQGNRILIIDQNGCGIDHYVMATPEYTSDLTTAFQETHVFKFAQKTITRFICQIQICLKGEECRKLSPPSACPSLEERIEQAKRLRSAPQNDIKSIFNAETSRSGEINEAQGVNEVEDISMEVGPPGIKPGSNERLNATGEGQIYFGTGYDAKRHRRQILIDEGIGKSGRISTENGYPAVDLVGEIRVIESEEDANNYEKQGSSSDCPSQMSFNLLLITLASTTLLLFLLGMFVCFRFRSVKQRDVTFHQ